MVATKLSKFTILQIYTIVVVIVILNYVGKVCQNFQSLKNLAKLPDKLDSRANCMLYVETQNLFNFDGWGYFEDD